MGCATLTAEADQAITVSTNLPDAACTLMNASGSWNIVKTPGSALVTRSFSPLTVLCTKDGLRGGAMLEAGTRGRAYGNLLMLGIPAVVDASTGAGYEYSPDAVFIELK